MAMATPTLDRVLAQAESLPVEEQEMLEELLRLRRVEAWRHETAAAAKEALEAFRSGRLHSHPANKIIARLRKAGNG